MGCGPSKAAPSSALDKELEARREAMAKRKRVLLLGTGESGKSSIVKQVKQIFAVRPRPQPSALSLQAVAPGQPLSRAAQPQGGLSESERTHIRDVLRQNVITCALVRDPASLLRFAPCGRRRRLGVSLGHSQER